MISSQLGYYLRWIKYIIAKRLKKREHKGSLCSLLCQHGVFLTLNAP